MKVIQLPDELAARLKVLGWEGAATIDVTACEKKLQHAYGLKISEVAREFLLLFGGLAISDNNNVTVHLTPAKIRTRERRGHLSWSNKSLYPIGILRDSTVILMNPDGVTFSFWDYLSPFADTPVATLQRFTQSIYPI
ncbi:SUKH-3 domain-containing protein [Stieleria varia]|uniref:SUKH-3 immunity protein n=1 Tax=Stieleria varia TaxID=2528005 RepID=A0A5C6B962_9BACT|nr:SUKH-3 domain-containing protein [Stieleria varia]TWU07806.1 hypothetical protein Pla52n_03810 [Stieleria varia]